MGSDLPTCTAAGSGAALPVEQALLLERACDRFESAWRSDRRLTIEDVVGGLIEPVRAATVRELVLLDADYRRAAGESPRADEYAGRFPELDAGWLARAVGGGGEPPDRTATAAAGAADPPPGTRVGYFGDYELLAEIARGGMGVVYRARQVSLDRVVALKMIRSGEFPSDAEARRFRQEVEAVAALDHPHVVPVYEVGEHRGRQYYTMRLVEGGTLAGRMGDLAVPTAAGRDRQAAVARLVASVARAVHHAHQRGILHRDLKPSNVLLDTAGEPHVADFGLARRLGAASSLTASGAVLGTPSYMAPEQARGGKDVTTAADVYGLGAVLYELLAGRPPFKGTDVLDTLAQVRERAVTRPRAVCPAVDADLETVCLKCLEKDPARRYGSATALADDLDRWRKGEPILARPAGTWERARKWARRNPAAATLVLCVLLASGSLAGMAVHFTAKLEEKRRDAEADRDAAMVSESRAADGEARAARGAADAQEQLDLSRRSLVTSQLLRVAQLADRDPMLGRQLLLDPLVFPTEVRDFTWGWYYARCSRQTRTLGPTGPKDRATAVAFSPDGRWIAYGEMSAQKQFTIRVCDAESSRPIASFNADARVEAIAFSRDGTLLASVAGEDGEVTIWELAGQRARHHLKPLGPHGSHLSFSSDGRTLFCANEGGLNGWETATGATRFRFPAQNVIAVMTPDGRTLAIGGIRVHESLGFERPPGEQKDDADSSIVLLETATGKITGTLRAHTSWITCLAASPDGKWLASGENYGGHVILWDLATKTEVKTLKGYPNGQLSSLCFSHDGRTLAANTYDIQVWDMPTGIERIRLRNSEDFTLNADGSLLAFSGSRIRTMAITVPPERLSFSTIPGLVHWQWSIRAASDGRRVVTGRQYGESNQPQALWDVTDGQRLARWEGDAFGLSGDGATIVFSRRDGERTAVVLRSAATGEERVLQLVEGGNVSELALNRDGRYLAVVAGTRGKLDPTVPGVQPKDRSEIRIWDTEAGRALHVPYRTSERVGALKFDSRDRLLFCSQTGGASSAPSRLLHWSVGSEGEPVPLPIVLDEFRDALALSPDGSTLACAERVEGRLRGVKLIDLVTGNVRARTTSTQGWIYSAAFSPDGRVLAVGGSDANVGLFDVRTGQHRGDLEGHAHSITHVTFDRGGHRLVSVDAKGIVKVWTAEFPPKSEGK